MSGDLAHRATGTLEKMRATVGDDGTVAYRLPLGEAEIALNPLLGQRIQLRFEDAIYCGRRQLGIAAAPGAHAGLRGSRRCRQTPRARANGLSGRRPRTSS